MRSSRRDPPGTADRIHPRRIEAAADRSANRADVSDERDHHAARRRSPPAPGTTTIRQRARSWMRENQSAASADRRRPVHHRRISRPNRPLGAVDDFDRHFACGAVLGNASRREVFFARGTDKQAVDCLLEPIGKRLEFLPGKSSCPWATPSPCPRIRRSKCHRHFAEAVATEYRPYEAILRNDREHLRQRHPRAGIPKCRKADGLHHSVVRALIRAR